MSTTTRYHQIENLSFEKENLVLIVDGHRLRLPLGRISPRLTEATPEQRARFEISSSGYGIHWPEIDEDLSVDGLLRVAASLGQ